MIEMLKPPDWVVTLIVFVPLSIAAFVLVGSAIRSKWRPSEKEKEEKGEE